MYSEPISPSQAIEEYLTARSNELADATVQNHRYRLKQFRLWCDEVEFTDMRELSGRETESFRLARESEGLAPMTVRNHQMTLRVFVEWCETQGYVKPGVSEKIRTPAVAKSDRTRDDKISHETAQDMINSLSRFEYGSLRHVLIHVLYHTGMRTGAARALDVDDFVLDPDPHLQVRHRPETGTPLKRGIDGERNVSIVDSELVKALQDYRDRTRPEVTDEDGREPLFASRQGRIAKTTIQAHSYRATQPCEWTGACPHDQEVDACPYRSADKASQCPSSISPHALRRSAITSHLDRDVPKDIVSGRTNVSRKRLDQHYDARDEESKRQTRRRQLENMDI
ncbi:tyrosine-type recombinase/integrase [Halapricum hydrolyticum]|uniref:tyrosine-type recombinase/integrase n=1 Tax=Halapricum hydrolyticum TaxID=2979991 RepID=UPI0036F4117A